jgi:hypothetical protein
MREGRSTVLTRDGTPHAQTHTDSLLLVPALSPLLPRVANPIAPRIERARCVPVYSRPVSEERERAAEARNILELCGGDAREAFDVVHSQLAVLVLRTQVMLSLSGIVITVTGFSGRAIAQTSALARGTIVAGLLIVLAGAAVAVWGVLRLRWLTQEIAPDPLQTLERALALRDRKSRFLSVALALFVTGFSLYCLAVAQLLVAP